MRKGKSDAAKAKVYGKIGKIIAQAVRQGGDDPLSNTRLREALAQAKMAKVPNDVIERNLQKSKNSTGEGEKGGGGALPAACPHPCTRAHRPPRCRPPTPPAHPCPPLRSRLCRGVLRGANDAGPLLVWGVGGVVQGAASVSRAVYLPPPPLPVPPFQVVYEAYGPGGTGFLIECLTDNVNRSASDVKAAITKGGGKVADPGSVAFNFQVPGGQRALRALGRGARLCLPDTPP